MSIQKMNLNVQDIVHKSIIIGDTIPGIQAFTVRWSTTNTLSRSSLPLACTVFKTFRTYYKSRK